MPRVITTFAVLSALLCPALADTEPKLGDRKVYALGARSAQLAFPRGWKVSNARPVAASAAEPGGGSVALDWTVTELRISEFVQNMALSRLRRVQKLEITGRGWIPCPGVQSGEGLLYLDYRTVDLEGVVEHARIYAARVGDALWTIRCTAPATCFEELGDTFHAMARTFGPT